ncbi:MAG TPA: VOC family protein [Steroidobacteraceae bacterium]|nr:VOC family protein [Steroidobacteraceae bacterium]
MAWTFVGRLERTARILSGALVLLVASVAVAADRYWPPIVDPATGRHTPGRWVWADLVTADVATAADFYGKVFGWTFETYGGTDDRETYTLALSSGLPIGGMLYDARALQGDTPSARWIGLVSVADPRAAAAAVTQHGGKVIYAPTMLGERGETAVFQDPEGTLFGVVNSRNGDPGDYLGDENEWVWLDLWSNDVARAAEFYRAVVGYETTPAGVDGTARSGVHLLSGGYVRAGIMQKQDPKTASVWLPYVRVASAGQTIDKARAAGGKVVYGPAAFGPGVIAILADPTGAPVGIVQLPATEAQP